MIYAFSVILPVYNGEEYIAEAIESVLSQSYPSFEFLIISDGSTDSTSEIVKQYAAIDSRIRFYDEPHRGLVGTLNRGLDLSASKYIARMDADDIARPQWLETMFEYMETHPQMGMCGCSIQVFNDTGNISVERYEVNDDVIKCGFIFARCGFSHPGIIMRRDVLERHSLRYDERYKHAEDFGLWVKSSQYTEMANVRSVMLNYRNHNNKVSTVYSDIQWENTFRIVLELLQNINIKPEQRELDCHSLLCSHIPECGLSLQLLQDTRNWLIKLCNKVAESGIHGENTLNYVFSRAWMNACYIAQCRGIPALPVWLSTPANLRKIADWAQFVKLSCRSIARSISK